MDRQTLTKEARGILIAILFLALGFLAIWGMKAMLIDAGDAVFVSLLLVPFIAYVILTDRVSEFKAPGGLEVKLVAMGDRPAMEFASQQVEIVQEDLKPIPKSGMDELERLEQLASASKRIILTLVLGQAQYDKEDAKNYIQGFLRYHNFQYVVFLDNNHRLVAFIAPWAMSRILEEDQQGFAPQQEQ